MSPLQVAGDRYEELTVFRRVLHSQDSSLLAHNLTHLTLHLPSLPYTLLNLPSDPRFPLESLTLFLPSTPNPPLITDAHAPLLRLFDPKQLTIRPPDEGARGIFNFVVQRKARCVRTFSVLLSRRVALTFACFVLFVFHREALSSYSSLNKLKYQTCNLLTFTTFPRPGSSCLSLFHRSDASSREEVEMVYDLRTLCFGRTFFEFFLGMREDEELGSAGEGEAVGGGGMDQVTVLVSDADKKEWVDQGLARKPFKGGTMRVRVLVQPSSSEEQEG